MSRRRARILVVDDNRDIVDTELYFLERRGYSLAWAYDGLTGLALATVTKPDLVLLNHMMPGMSGLDVLRELRADPRTARMKVVMTSAWAPIVMAAPAAGAQGVLVVPWRSLDLLETVARVLGE